MNAARWTLIVVLLLAVGASGPSWRLTKEDHDAILRLVVRPINPEWLPMSIQPGETKGTATVRMRQWMRAKEGGKKAPEVKIVHLKKGKDGWQVESEEEVSPESP
jgi:hypothetical protein